jgi:hypothetical protein
LTLTEHLPKQTHDVKDAWVGISQLKKNQVIFINDRRPSARLFTEPKIRSLRFDALSLPDLLKMAFRREYDVGDLKMKIRLSSSMTEDPAFSLPLPLAQN